MAGTDHARAERHQSGTMTNMKDCNNWAISRTTRAVGTQPVARTTLSPFSERDTPTTILAACNMAANTGAHPTGRLERFLHILVKQAIVYEELAMWIANRPRGPHT